MSDMLGIPEDALAGQPLLETLIPAAALGERVTAALATGAPQDAVVVPVDGRADGVRWFEFNVRRTSQAGGDLLLLIGQDVTFRRQARLRLQESEEFFRLTFSQAAIGIALLSREGRFLRVNRKLSRIVGYSEIELLQRFFDQVTHPDERDEDRALVRRLVAGEVRDFRRESRYLCKDGSTVWVALSASTMREAASGQLRLIVAVQDISRRKQAEEALLRMASHDALTGLPNRSLLQDRLAQAMAHAQRAAQQVARDVLDLDRFKHVNDSLGHEPATSCCARSRARLRAALRDERHGGAPRRRRIRGGAAPTSAAGRRCRAWPPSCCERARASRWRSAARRCSSGAASASAMYPQRRRATREAAAEDGRHRDVPRQGRAAATRYRFYAAADDRGSAGRACASRTACGAAWRATNSCCTTSRRWTWRAAGSSASRRWCAGSHPERGHGAAGRLHPAGRGDRPDRADRRLGAARRPAPAGALCAAGRRRAAARGREHVGAPVQRSATWRAPSSGCCARPACEPRGSSWKSPRAC